MKQKKKNTELLIKNKAPTSITSIATIPNNTNKLQITTKPQATNDIQIFIEIVHTTTSWMQPQNIKKQPYRQQKHRTQQKPKRKQPKLVRQSFYNFADLLKCVITIIATPLLKLEYTYCTTLPSCKEDPNLFGDHPT